MRAAFDSAADGKWSPWETHVHLPETTALYSAMTARIHKRGGRILSVTTAGESSPARKIDALDAARIAWYAGDAEAPAPALGDTDGPHPRAGTPGLTTSPEHSATGHEQDNSGERF